MLVELMNRATAAAVVAALMVAACADGGMAPPANFATGPQGLGRVYRLGIGDKLKVAVFGEENLSGPAEVNAFGNVSLPLIGEVPAKGQSIAEFRETVARRLADGYLKNPKVTVEITNYRPIYVHGEVKSGGEFPFKTGLKVRDAIATAGGYTYRANEGYLVIVREGEEPLKLAMPSNIDVLPGDNIRVPERYF